MCVFYDLPLQSQVSEVLAASDGGDDSWPFDMEDRQRCGNIDGFCSSHTHTNTKGQNAKHPFPLEKGKKFKFEMGLIVFKV